MVVDKLYAEWFADKRRLVGQVARRRFLSSACDNDLDVGPFFRNAMRQLEAVDGSRHFDVGEQEGDGLAHVTKQNERLITIARLVEAEASILKNVATSSRIIGSSSTASA